MDTNIINIVNDINRFAPDMGGSFSSSDLFNIIGSGSHLQNSRTIQKLVKLGVLFRVQRGIYTTKECDLWILTARLDQNAYISMDSVLAKNGLTGTLPSGSVSAIHPGRYKIIRAVSGNIYFHSLSKELFFGIEPLSTGVKVADSEKAFIDLLYFYTKGVRFAIDPIKDVLIDKLDKEKISKYLKRYKNPKFVKFIKGLIYE